MFNLPAIQMQRNAWALNDITAGVLKATHVAYVVKYGQPPIYMITELATNKTYKFRGSIALMRRLYSRKIFSEILLTMSLGSYQDGGSTEDRMKFIDNQIEGEIEAPKDEVNLKDKIKRTTAKLQLVVAK
jgi:hypothetical protein